jgi:hypothetical protein
MRKHADDFGPRFPYSFKSGHPDAEETSRRSFSANPADINLPKVEIFAAVPGLAESLNTLGYALQCGKHHGIIPVLMFSSIQRNDISDIFSHSGNAGIKSGLDFNQPVFVIIEAGKSIVAIR